LKRRMNPIILKVITYVSSALALTVFGFIFFDSTFMTNVFVTTIALYAGISIVVGRELKNLWKVYVISFPFIIFSDVLFSFLQEQEFIALSISLVVLLVIIRYSLIKDHDSGWFGAICAELIGQIFLLVIEVVLAMVHLFLF
jgi:hypothetical protein